MPFVPVAGPGFEEQKETGGFVPVSAKLFGEEHPIVGELPSPYRGVASKPVVSFRLPTEDDPEHRIFLSPSDDGGLPNVLKKVGDSFVVSGRFDDGRRDAADAGQLRPLDRPFVPAKPAAAEGSPDPLAILSQPSVMSLLKSRNPERWRSEVEPLLQQADEFGRHPFEKADAKSKAAKILNEMMPEGGLGTQYQSEKKQVASGRKVMQRPTIIDSNGRVQYFPELKPRENVGDEVPIDEGVLRGDHEAARLEYQRSKRPDSVLGRQAERLRAGVEGVSGALWRPFLPQDVSDELVRNQESQGQAFNEVSGPIERQVGGAIQSAGTMLAAAPVAAMTGPAAPLVFGGAAGLSTGNQALTQATDAGLSGEQRIGHALMQGGLEAGVSGVFSKVLGMPGMEGALSRALGQRITSQSAAKIGALVAGRLAKAGLEEVPEELVTSAAQNAASRLSGVDPNKGLLDPEEAADVIVQSFIGGAGANLPGSVLGARRENPTAYKNLTRDLPIGSNPTTKTGEKVRIVGYDDQNVVVQPVQTVGGKEQLVGEKRTVPQSELKPEFTPYEHSREFADKWAAENPEAAKALAAKAGEQPSIADFEKAGLNRRGVSAGQRKEFVDWLAEGELLRSKSAASTDTGFMTPPVEQPKQLGPDVPKRVTDRMKNALANRGFDRAFIDTLSPVQAQAILANRKGTKLGQKAEVPPTDEAAIAPKTEARDALIKFVAEKNYSDPKRFEFRDADLEYQRLKAAYDAEIRSNAAREAAKSRRETSAEREQAQAAIEEGQIDRENAKFAPLNMMDEQLAQKIREEAKIQFENSDSEDTRAALQKIIDGNDVNAGGKVEAQKERIIKILSGELDQRTGWTRKTEAPRPADPIATGLLKSQEERQSDIDEAVKALADGTPNTIVDEARRLAGEELNQDRDIELPYLEPGEQQILDKIDEIAGKLGVEPKGKPVIEGMEDDSFDFGANVEEKSKPVSEESNPPKTYRDVMRTAKEEFDAVYGDRDENGERKAEEPKPKKLGEKSGGSTSEIMAKVRRDANQRDLEDHERSLSGVNFWGRGIDPELGDQFDAHGLSAQDLQSLLENGIDENRPFHTARISDPADGLGLRDHQPFVVVGHPGKGLKEGGIRAVVVDPLHTPSIPDLQKAFPGMQFIPAENSAIELAKIAKEEGSPAKPKKLGPAVEQPAKSDTVADRYRRTSGNELGEVVAPKTQSQRDAVDFFKARGKTVKFFAPPNNSQAASFFDPKTGDVYLNANVSDAERFSYLIGHEYAHASGADSRLADLPKQLLDSAKAYYLERSNPNYRQKLLDDDALLTREAVAVFVGRVFSDPKYRSLIRNENPGVLEKIVEFVKSLFVGDDYAKLPEAVRRVVDELNSHVQPKGRKLGGGDSGNGNRYDTYAGFAEPNRGTAAGKLGAAVAEAMGENEKPKWSMEDVAEGAIAAEAKNPEKARAEIEKLLKGDAPLTKEQTALANVVKRRLASEYVKTGDAAALKEYIDFKQRYFVKRSQAGDILRVGQEDLFSKMETREGREQALADALLDMTPAEVERLDAAVKKLREAGIDEEDLLFSEEDYLGNALNQKSDAERKKLGDAKKKADASRPLLEGRQAEAEYRHVLGSIEARQAAFRKQMIDKGVIPKSQAEYEKFIKDPLKVQQAIIEINAHKSTAGDRLLEYWYNAVLSAPTTHVKNVTGNVINGGRMAAVGFTKIIGEVATLQKKPEHAVSELAAFWSGFWGGLMPAARNFTTAWNTELSALARKIGRDKRSSPLEWAEGVASIPGMLGRVIRYPKRFMLAVDEFFKTLTVHMNVGVEAHRLAVEEGKSGRELAKRQAELVADPTSLAWNRAYDTALEVSMQEEGGKFRQGVKHAIAAGRRIPYVGYASKFLIPFTNIAINSASQVGLQSPLGMIPAIAKVVSNIRNGDPMLQGMSGDLARQAVGFAATMAIYSLVGDDNDDEKVTILGKDSKEHKYSIKFGDRYFTYSGIEPIGSFLGLIADASQSAKSGGDAMAMFGDLARSVGNQLAEKPLLGAVTEAAKFATADFGEQVTSEKAAGALMAWAARFGGSFVPAIAKAPERALRGESVERMTWKGNTTEETLGRLGERALSKTDLGLVEESSKFDKWGRKYPETAIEGHPIADFLFRMLSPGKLIKYEPHDGDKLIAKWNNANPKEVYNPSVLDPFYTLNGEKTYFTDKQYARYAEQTGKLASKLFELGKFDAENPTAEQVDAIRDNFTAAKAAIKEHLHEEILAGKQSPIDLDTLAKRLTIKMRKTAAEKLSEGLGARKLGESDATREMKRQKWQEARGQALARLQRLSSD